ncbi:MAG: glucose-6-phosphate isomerase [Rhodocyclaceae bacterium]|jgi:glucose-6-phosphate isomerase|nr:glucose-6-phosphate isomerase [Rhodocyclaceae bacterium]
MTPLTQTPEWQALAARRDALAGRHLNQLFVDDPQRFARFSFRCGELLADFSKQRIDAETIALLVRLAETRGLAGFLRRMAAGEAINTTENRAALHIALRAEKPYRVGDRDVLPEVRATRARMRELSEAIRTGAWRGSDGQAIEAVVNLGIGGSDLGPRMAAQALGASANAKLTLRFVANIDPAEFADSVRDLDPTRTLFIVSSKTFTTQETLANARAAKAWLGTADPAQHFLAVSNNIAAAQAFGIPPENCLAMADWVGGRFSMWSAIGLPLACSIGMDAFEDLLAGAREMDEHFLSAPYAENLPVLMALIGLWNIDFLGAESLAVIPYAHRLGLLPAYLQQLEMESNGKRVTLDNEAVGCATAPILWGMAGSVGQHAFHQLFYQGTRLTPIDFVVPVGESGPEQEALVANALAQGAALMKGKSLEEATAQLIAAGKDTAEAERLAPHLVCPGNQPSTTLLMPALTPRALGNLIALYEHKVAAQGCLWGVNSFDQWGVEHGKQMAREILPKMLTGEGEFDASTAGLLAAIRAMPKA